MARSLRLHCRAWGNPLLDRAAPPELRPPHGLSPVHGGARPSWPGALALHAAAAPLHTGSSSYQLPLQARSARLELEAYLAPTPSPPTTLQDSYQRFQLKLSAHLARWELRVGPDRNMGNGHRGGAGLALARYCLQLCTAPLSHMLWVSVGYSAQPETITTRSPPYPGLHTPPARTRSCPRTPQRLVASCRGKARKSC